MRQRRPSAFLYWQRLSELLDDMKASWLVTRLRSLSYGGQALLRSASYGGASW